MNRLFFSILNKNECRICLNRSFMTNFKSSGNQSNHHYNHPPVRNQIDQHHYYQRFVQRNLSSKNRLKHLERMKYNVARTMNDMPDFKSLLRQFYKRSHPDLLRAQNASAADLNDKSFKELNGILDTIKGVTEYPPSMLRTIPFYIINTDQTITKVQITLRTAGGDSRKQLSKCFSSFFKQIGILQTEHFIWNEEYFQPFQGEKESMTDEQSQ